MQNEPVRLSGYVALVVGLALLAAFGWSQGLDLQQIVGQTSIVALTSIGGLEFARSRVTPTPKPDGLDEHRYTHPESGHIDLNAALTVLVVIVIVIVIVRLV